MDTKPKYSLLEARQKLEAYCAYQERCAQEIRDKCKNWRMDYEHTDILIADLISNNFLNEERFAKAFVSGKFRIKKWVRNKIRLHLKQKNISDYSIRSGMEEIEEEEYLQTLSELVEKKVQLSTEKDPWKLRVKLQRYLNSKGYEGDLIRNTLEDWFAK